MNSFKDYIELLGRKMGIAFISLFFIFLITITVILGNIFFDVDFKNIEGFLINTVIALSGVIATSMGANAVTHFSAKTDRTENTIESGIGHSDTTPDGNTPVRRREDVVVKEFR
jgi:hypothetical protein